MKWTAKNKWNVVILITTIVGITIMVALGIANMLLHFAAIGL